MSDNNTHEHEEPKVPAPEQHEVEPPEETEEADTGHRALADALRVSFGFLKVAMVILIALYVLSGLFTVGTDEVKIRLTFGRPAYKAGKIVVMDSESGWHIKWPWQEVVTVSTVEREIPFDQAFWHKESVVPGQEEEAPPEEEEAPPGQPGGGLNPATDRYLITGDANIIHLKLSAKYRVTAARAADYAFRVSQPEKILTGMVKAAAISVVGRMNVDDVLTHGRARIVSGVMEETRRRMAEFEKQAGHTLGVRLTGVEYKDLIVPKPVKGAFDQADAARSEFYTKKRQAEARKNQMLRSAEGEAAELVAEAESEQTRLVTSARADAKRIEELSAVYKKYPKTFRQEYFTEVMEEVLAGSKQVWVLHSTDPGARREIRLQLNPRPQTERKRQGPGHPPQAP